VSGDVPDCTARGVRLEADFFNAAEELVKNGCAPRSTDDKPEPRFSGLRSSVFDANAASRTLCS
jgi:hypothetical protein